MTHEIPLDKALITLKTIFAGMIIFSLTAAFIAYEFPSGNFLKFYYYGRLIVFASFLLVILSALLLKKVIPNSDQRYEQLVGQWKPILCLIFIAFPLAIFGMVTSSASSGSLYMEDDRYVLFFRNQPSIEVSFAEFVELAATVFRTNALLSVGLFLCNFIIIDMALTYINREETS